MFHFSYRRVNKLGVGNYDDDNLAKRTYNAATNFGKKLMDATVNLVLLTHYTGLAKLLHSLQPPWGTKPSHLLGAHPNHCQHFSW